MPKIPLASIPGCFKFYLESFARRFNVPNDKWVAGRTACLGNDVFALLKTPYKLFNMQKGRIDYILEVGLHPEVSARPLGMSRFLSRTDIFPLVLQQSGKAWFDARPPEALFMDSYSELTDQIFVHRVKKWKFCCNYSDLIHSMEFEQKFISAGLISVESMTEVYREFFEFVRRLWNNIPIVFLHFPVKLDSREKFRERSRAIQKSISEIQMSFPPFYSLEVPEHIVDWPEIKIPGLEKFPYHYNKQTYQAFAEQIKSIGLFKASHKK